MLKRLRLRIVMDLAVILRVPVQVHQNYFMAMPGSMEPNVDG
jgi:hypothetical protein